MFGFDWRGDFSLTGCSARIYGIYSNESQLYRGESLSDTNES